MASAREKPAWRRFLAESQSTRRKLEGLLANAREVALDPEGDVLNATSALRPEFDQWIELSRRAATELASCAQDSAKAKGKYEEELPDRLRRLLASAGLTIYGDSSLIILEGIVHIQLELTKPRVTINDEAQPDLSLPALAEAAITEVQRLKGLATEPLEFLELMLKAYRSVLALRGAPVGSQVGALDLLPHVLLSRQSRRFLENPGHASFRAYGLAEYRADILGLLDLPRETQRKSEKFHWASGSDTKGAVFMFVPSLARTAYVGRVWFG